MTNEQIIWNRRVTLMENNVIGSTGNEVVVQGDNGKPQVLREPEAIHTYQVWKEKGRQVRKGEHAVCDCMVWKHTIKPSRDTNEPDEERLIKVKAYFFTIGQTDPIDTHEQIMKGENEEWNKN